MVRNAPGVELVAVVDPDPAALEREELTPGYATLEKALADVGGDAVLVASPPRTHHAVAKTALEAGKHVLCEKPLATSLDDALDLVETSDRTKRLVVVSQNYRYNAPFLAVQRVLDEGHLGDLASISVRCMRDTKTLFGPDDFRYSMRHLYVLDMSIHHFDLVRAATGREVRRLVLAMNAPERRRRFHLGWSSWRRAHQAVAKRCRKASLAAKRAARHAPGTEGPPDISVIAPEEARLTDEQWASVSPLLPPQRGEVGRPPHDHREVLGGILWVARTGSSWREMPEEFGKWERAYRRHELWLEQGLWQRILEALGEGPLPGPATEGQ